MKLSNLSIKSKLVSIVILSVVLLVMASTFNLMQQRASSMEERQDKLSAQVETAVSLAQHYYDQRNVLGEETAKKQALQAIETLRYDSTNYFWILNQQLNIISHPLKPELNGKNAGNLRDGGGKHHWREMVTISQTAQQKGFLDYQWKSPNGELKEKSLGSSLSYDVPHFRQPKFWL